MANIGLERVERDCPYNVEARQKDGRLITDFNIRIDNELRAVAVSAGARERGYRLLDANRDPVVIDRGYSLHLGEEITKQSDIIPTVERALAADKIPTMQQLTENRRKKIETRNEAARKEFASRVASWQNHFGVELYDTLTEIVATLDIGERVEAVELIAARKLLERINSEIFDDVGAAPKLEPLP